MILHLRPREGDLMAVPLPDARELSDEVLETLRLRALHGCELGFRLRARCLRRRSPIWWAWTSLGPRPMYSCSKRDIPSQMAASISPCVFMATSDKPRLPTEAAHRPRPTRGDRAGAPISRRSWI